MTDEITLLAEKYKISLNRVELCTLERLLGLLPGERPYNHAVIDTSKFSNGEWSTLHKIYVALNREASKTK